MTWKPEDIVVSGAEVLAFIEAHKREVAKRRAGPKPPGERFDPQYCERLAIRETGAALRAVLAARMPEKIVSDCGTAFDEWHADGHNAALDAVARGKGT
ncbi:MAG: hypothetical protein ING29_08600 [Azospirillum sp.]|nr:hypothetical protein [Azospirillum sp.]